MAKTLTRIFACGFLFCSWCTAPGSSGALSENCLTCICEASSSCNPSVGCMTYGDDNTGQVCGPFQVTRSYWEDAGRLGGDFVTCVTTMSCSRAAVFNYMTRFAKDCDGDGQVTCEDYARLHTAGVNGCDGPWVELTRFWAKFKTCRERSTEHASTLIESRAMLRGA